MWYIRFNTIAIATFAKSITFLCDQLHSTLDAMKNSKTVMKSFRIDTVLADMISRSAAQKRISESSYVSKQLESSLKDEVICNLDKELRLSASLFQRIICATNPSALDILACEFAKDEIPYMLELLGLELTLSSFEYFLKGYLQNWGWFQMEVRVADQSRELLFMHKYGRNWSVFLSSFLISGFETVLSFRPQVVVVGEMVKACIKKELSVQ